MADNREHAAALAERLMLMDAEEARQFAFWIAEMMGTRTGKWRIKYANNAAAIIFTDSEREGG